MNSPARDHEAHGDADDVLAALAIVLRPLLVEANSTTERGVAQWLSPAQAAEHAGVHRRTIYRALAAGALCGGRVATTKRGSRWRIRLEDVDAWIEAGAPTTADRPPAVTHTRPREARAERTPTTSSYRRRARRAQPQEGPA